MYQFSRAIYRDLLPYMVDRRGDQSHRRVLEACEQTMDRLLADRWHFARPSKVLFAEIRNHIPMEGQQRALEIVDRNIRMAIRFLETAPPEDLLIAGARECRAHTRKGTPCERERLPGLDYCPSHKHLEEEHEAAPIVFSPARAA